MSAQFLSGEGSKSLLKSLVVSKTGDKINPEAKNSLLRKLDMFLPQLEKANASLPIDGTSSSAVEVILSEDEEEEDEAAAGKVEMNIQMYPMAEDEESSGEEAEEQVKPSSKKPKVEELD
jgi:hypothetical protein